MMERPQTAHQIRVVTFRRLLRYFTDSSLSVSDLSSALHISRRQLHRSFEGLITPHELLQVIRLTAALVMFADPQMGSIEEIALAVGLTSRIGLNRLMCGHLGLSPSALRDQIRQVRMSCAASATHRSRSISMHTAAVGLIYQAIPDGFVGPPPAGRSAGSEVNCSHRCALHQEMNLHRQRALLGLQSAIRPDSRT